MTHEAVLIEGHPGQVIGCMALIDVSTPIMSFIPPNITASNPETPLHSRGTVYQGILQSSIMIEQSVMQAAPSSIETLSGTKSKFEAWIGSIENAVQISGQNEIHIAFSKLTHSPLSKANRLKARLPNLTWMELRKELFMQY